MIDLFIKIKKVFLNIFILFINLFIRRDRSIWLFGAWMGERFADNSRFLYEYLDKNGDKFGIKKVIWFTRSTEIYLLLKSKGYNVVYNNSVSSFYWHLKSGVHVVCNARNEGSQFKGDLRVALSTGAIKIQMWHGVGIKACGGLTKYYKKTSKEIEHVSINKSNLFSELRGLPGGWSNCYWICTSDENERVAVLDYFANPDKIIKCNYARMIPNKCLFDNERDFTEILKMARSEYSIFILYAPTFRNDGNKVDVLYKSPSEIEGFKKFIKENRILWMEKRHAIYNNQGEIMIIKDNILYIDPSFDANIILDSFTSSDIVITDYSSICTDAMFNGIKVMFYAPDYDYYIENDRGFVNEYEKYTSGFRCFDSATFLSCLNKTIYEFETVKDEYNKTKNFLLAFNDDKTMETIIATIINSII